MKDAIEIMALGQCSRWNWEWDKMTPERRELSFSEMRQTVASLDAAGYAIVPKDPTEEMVAAGCEGSKDSMGNMHQAGGFTPYLIPDCWAAMLAVGALTVKE